MIIILLGGALTLAEAKPSNGSKQKSKSRSTKTSKVAAKQKKEPEAPVVTEFLPGEALLTEDPAFVPEPLEPLELELPRPEEIAGDTIKPLTIPEKFLTAYFDERPRTLLVDPQGLLSATDFNARLNALEYHVKDSSIDLFVYIFEKDQEIPTDVRSEEVIERFYQEGRPALVAYYYLGAPKRSVLRLSPILAEKIPIGEQRQALENAVLQALEKTETVPQLEGFMTQLAMRSYWMDQIISGGQPVNEAALQPLVSPMRVKKKSAKAIWLQEQFDRFAMPTAMVVGGLFLLGGLIALFRWKRRYVFPEVEVEPRLGGAYAAGIGAVISFGSAAVTPASQREQMPGNLRL